MNGEDDDVMAALDGALEAVEQQPQEAVDQQPAKEVAVDGAGETAQEPVADEPADGEPPAEQPAEDVDAEVEAEIQELKATPAAATRIRELSKRVKELNETLRAAGVEDVSTVGEIAERAKLAEDLTKMVMDTGATAEQYGQSLEYLRMVNAAKNGDRASAEKAFAVIEGEYRALALALGRKVDGIDQFAGWDDVRKRVEDGLLDEQDALEIIRLRNAERQMMEQRQSHQVQTAQQQAVESGRQALMAWDAQMAASDPTYAAKRDILSAQVAVIRQNLPPSQWVAATQQLYATLPAPAVQQQQKPAPGPVRPGRAPALKREFDDPMDALNWALGQQA